MMNIQLESIPAKRIAYVRQAGPYGPANVQAMEQLKGWAREQGLLQGSVSGCCTLLHHLQEFRGLEQVSAGFVASHAGFQHRSFLLVRIVAFHAGFH
ncbi:GyrI-like domain-containing protein [Paenibacillus sp. FSL H8-0122]|uniref:GyrI-like domain-containing protein n=1 Tax=Paenibacillus sp. FSL H8-0122 TaxID=2954510 RepID=UPI0030FB3001